MAANVTPLCYAAKVNDGRGRRASGYQLARQGALRGYGEAVAARRGIAFSTLMHEVDDPSRDPVLKVVATMRAMRESNAAPERIRLYVLQILRELHHAALQERGNADGLTQLIGLESQVDADENVVGERALLNGLSPADRRAWAERILRSIAVEFALVDRLLEDSDDSYAVAW